MTLDQAKKIVEILNDEGVEARVYENYSGRGMYGATCTGIVCDDPVSVGAAASRARVKKADRPRRSDNLGRSLIIY